MSPLSKYFENEHTLINTRERITEKGKSAPIPRVNVYIDFTPSLHTCQILSINIFLCNRIVSYFPASVNTFCEILIISAFCTKIFYAKRQPAMICIINYYMGRRMPALLFLRPDQNALRYERRRYKSPRNGVMV